MADESWVRLEGLALSGWDEAASGASVRARVGDVDLTRTTDENGHFDFGRVPAGQLVLAVEWGDFRVEEVLVLEPGRTFVSAHVEGGITERPGRLAGRFADETGGSVEGVAIAVDYPDSGERLEAETDSAGRFEISPLPAGRARLTAARDGVDLVDAAFPVGWLADEWVEIDAERGFERELGFLGGRVWDADFDGVEGATVRITEALNGESRTVVTGDFGDFELEPGVAWGMYHVEVLRGDEVLIERRIVLHPHMYLEISLVEGMREGGAEAEPAPLDGEFHTVTIFYGTDRRRRDSEEPSKVYGGERGELELGTCAVSIPLDHELGELESPSFWRLEFREDPEKHVVLLSVEPQARAEFLSELRERIEASAARRALVFVHGYNVTFEDAARRTGQMAYDLQFDGAPILYSWPSKGSLQGYMADEASAAYTVPHLEEFLRLVARESGAEIVHLIAHSMGNRAMAAALAEISREPDGPRFQQIALVAPDIDADVFKRDIAPRIVTTGDRVTLYASATDEALDASKRIHAAPRAGDASEGAVVVPGIDTIDVTGLDTSLLGHSYFAENRSVIADLIYLLHEGSPPDERHWLQPVVVEGDESQRYWRFLPDQP